MFNENGSVQTYLKYFGRSPESKDKFVNPVDEDSLVAKEETNADNSTNSSDTYPPWSKVQVAKEKHKLRSNFENQTNMTQIKKNHF